jgi:hypothetical protein
LFITTAIQPHHFVIAITYRSHHCCRGQLLTLTLLLMENLAEMMTMTGMAENNGSNVSSKICKERRRICYLRDFASLSHAGIFKA